VRRIDSPSHLGRGRREEAGRRRPAEAGGAARGGGTAGPGRGLGAAVVVVELEGEVEGLFIGEERQGRGGERWRWLAGSRTAINGGGTGGGAEATFGRWRVVMARTGGAEGGWASGEGAVAGGALLGVPSSARASRRQGGTVVQVMDGEQAAQVGGWRVGRTGGPLVGRWPAPSGPARAACERKEEEGEGRKGKEEKKKREKGKRKKIKEKREREGKRELPARFAAAVGHAHASRLRREATRT